MSNERTNEELLQEIEEVKRENELLRKKLQEEIDSLGNSFKELEESEKKYRKLFEGTLDVIYQTDINGNITEISPSIEKYSGYTRQELIGTNVSKTYYDPEDRKEFLRQLLTNGKVVDYELRLKTKSNQLIYTASTSHIVYNEAGKPFAIEGVLRDITHRKRIEIEIAKHHQELELIRETTKIANSRLDINFVLDYILKSTTQTVNASVGMIFLKDAETGNLIWGASLGLSDDFKNSFNKTQIKFGEGLTGIIAQTVEPIYIQENSSNDPRVVRSVIQKEGLNSFIGVPILADNEVIGVMNVLTRPPEILTEHDIFVCQTIGSQVGFAIRNAQLYARQKEIEEYLVESTSQFKSLFLNSPDAIFIADAQTGLILDANIAAEKMMKLPIQEIVGLHQKELHPRSTNLVIKDTFKIHKQELEKLQVSIPTEEILLCSDGTEVPIEIVASKVLYKGKDCMMGIFRDISERKRYERELYQAKEIAELNSVNVTAIIENTNDSIWAFDKNYDIIYINNIFQKEFFSAFGVFLEPGSNIYESLPEVLGPLWKSRYDRVLNNEQFTLVDTVETQYGEIYIEVSMNPILRNGELIGGSCFGSDITRRKLAEKEQKYQYQMQTILMNIASHYINIPLDLVEVTINRSLMELGQFANVDRVYIFDYDWENDECHNTYEWCNDNIQPEIDNLQNVPLSMMTWWVEAHKKGEMLYIPDVFALSEDDGVRILLEPQGVKSLLTIPLITNEECIGFVGFDSVNSKQNYTESEQKLLTVFAQMLVNIKIRTKLEKSLIEAKEKAEESDRLKTAFLQNMSHEIRTPLNGIIGFTTLLTDPELSQEEMKEITAVIKHSGNRLIEMVNNVLDISKIETGQVEVYRMTFPVESLLDDLYSFFSSLTESKGLKLIFEAKNGNLRIDSDYQKLYQILSNLINNAVKFTSTGSIEMGYNLKETLIEFYVKDTGVGIAENIQQRIFERFMQADTSISRNYEGAGIGLSICKGLVEILGGKIWVESKFGSGSIFYFTVPLNCENLS